MSNLLAIAANWTAYDDTSPPDYWDGTKYTRNYEESSSQGQFFQMTFGGTIADGDVFAGNLSLIQGILHDQPPFGNTCYINLISTGGTVLATAGPAATTNPINFSFTAAQGKLILAFHPDDIDPGANYDGITNILPVANPTADCQELGRVTKALVSAYTASRRETRRIRRFAKRCCVGQFNASMPKGCTITSVRFETTSPWSLLMSNPRIESTGRSAAVDVQFNFAGLGGLIITATWSNGEVNNVEFWFTVIDQPLYPTAQYPSSTGPYLLTAQA